MTESKTSHADLDQLDFRYLTLEAPAIKITEFSDSINPEEAAHNEPPHLDIQYLQTSSFFYTFFLKFCRCKFCHLLFYPIWCKGYKPSGHLVPK